MFSFILRLRIKGEIAHFNKITCEILS